MAVFKKVLKNVFIVLGIILGIFFICLAIMFFAKVSMFGLKFKKIPANAITGERFNTTEFQSVTINTKNVNVDIVSNTEGDIFALELKDDSLGLCKKDKATLFYTTKIEENEVGQKNLVITLEEPEGWVFLKNSWLTLTLSDNIITSDSFKLVINSNNGDVSVRTNLESSQLNSIYFTSNKGNFESSDKIDNLNIKTNKGDIDLANEVETLNLISNKGDLKFTSIRDLNIETNSSYILGEQVFNSFSYKGKSGKIDVKSLGNRYLSPDDDINTPEDDGYYATYTNTDKINCYINTQSAEIHIKSFVGFANIQTTSGLVDIDEFYGESASYYENIIQTTSGMIKIGMSSFDKLTLESVKGKIQVGGICGGGRLVVNNNKGKIEINAKGEFVIGRKRAAQTDVYENVMSESKYLDSTLNGSIATINNEGTTTIKNVYCQVYAKSTKSGKINIDFMKVNKRSYVESAKGKITINAIVNENYNLITKADKKNVDINMASIGLNINNKSHERSTYKVCAGSDTSMIDIYSIKGNIVVNQIVA